MSERATRLASAAPMLGLGAICAAAFLLRFLPILLVPNLHQPDELYQSIEQAHRLVYGVGIVPWEFQYGARSWFLPYVLAGIMWLAHFVGDGPAYYLPAIFGTLALLATACVPIAFLWGRRFYGTAGGLVAAWAMALSVDAIYFGPRAGQEVIAAHLVVIGAYLAEPGYRPQSRARLVAAGLIFGIAFTVRFHLAPALALLVLWLGWGAWRERFWPLFAGACASAILGGLIDWPTWGFPFASIWYNFDYNILYGVNAFFGTPGWDVYPAFLVFFWSGGAAVILFLAALGSFRLPMVGAAAAVTYLQYVVLPHKEFRLIFPAVLLAAMLAALGLARIVTWAERELRAAGRVPEHALHVSGTVAFVFWLVFAMGEATSAGYAQLWWQDEGPLLLSLRIAQEPNICGVAIDAKSGLAWTWTGGYSYMHRPLALYETHDEAALVRGAPLFNAMVYLGKMPAVPDFRERLCRDGACLAERSGGCAAAPGPFKPAIPPSLAGVTPLAPP
jgi:hypothetical protein